MADLGFDYDAEQFEPLAPRDPIPADKYEAMIIESERKPTRDGNGELLNLVWVVTSGKYEGRKVYDRVNLKNNSDKAVEIGMRQLSAICHATGKLRVTDSAELHNLPCTISVKVVPAGPDKNMVHRDAKNENTGYSPIGASAPASSVAHAPHRPAPGTAAAPARTTTSTAPAKKPWERK
jgi:hypothetical protein